MARASRFEASRFESPSGTIGDELSWLGLWCDYAHGREGLFFRVEQVGKSLATTIYFAFLSVLVS